MKCISTACDLGDGMPFSGDAADEASADEVARSARAAMSAVCEAGAGRRRDPPFDEDGHGRFLEAVPAVLRVWRAALQIEPDPIEAASWYHRTRIAELGSFTAAQLVSPGRSDEVVAFLLSVRDGERD